MEPQRNVHIRSHIARALYNRILEDQFESVQDHSHWYSVDTNRFSGDYQQLFLQSYEDEETRQFLESCYQKSDWLFTQIFHSFMKFILSWLMTQTSINGLLRRGSMFVLSQHQFQSLMSINSNSRLDRLLDLGAGDGMVTKQMAPHFNEVFVTEMSTTMKWRLQEHGFVVLDADGWFKNTTTKYDVVSCLNLLDRCDRPIELLEQIRSVMDPTTGRLLLAVVLPFSPYVEMGTDGHEPNQFLKVQGTTIEDQVQSFVEHVLNPLGFVLERFTRLPYLCEGDLYHSFYTLTDVVFVLKLKDH